MKKTSAIIIILVALVIAISALIQYQSHSKFTITGFVTEQTFTKSSDLFFDYEITRYPSKAEVISHVITNETLVLGVDIDPTDMNFGIIPGNGSFSRRFINLSNNEAKDVKISFTASGSIAPFINFSQNDFILVSMNNVIIDAYFNTKNAEIGNYTGEIDIIIKKPRYWFVYGFW